MLSELLGTGVLLGTILDAIPASIFMVDKDVEVLGGQPESPADAIPRPGINHPTSCR